MYTSHCLLRCPHSPPALSSCSWHGSGCYRLPPPFPPGEHLLQSPPIPPPPHFVSPCRQLNRERGGGPLFSRLLIHRSRTMMGVGGGLQDPLYTCFFLTPTPPPQPPPFPEQISISATIPPSPSFPPFSGRELIQAANSHLLQPKKFRTVAKFFRPPPPRSSDPTQFVLRVGEGGSEDV